MQSKLTSVVSKQEWHSLMVSILLQTDIAVIVIVGNIDKDPGSIVWYLKNDSQFTSSHAGRAQLQLYEECQNSITS